MTIGFHCPRPPARTGVADYGAALASCLQQYATIRWNPSVPCDVELYHLGNNPLHAEIYARSLQRPGVVVLHDAVLHHFFLGTLTTAQYIDEFVFNYGEWSRSFAMELYRHRARSSQDPRYFAYPMIRRAVQSARAVIVHNPGAARMAAEQSPVGPVIEIPHLFQAPRWPDQAQVRQLRHELGVEAGGLLFGVFGHLRESKRLPIILRAFRRVRQRHPAARLLVAGHCASDDLARWMELMRREPGIIVRPHLPERRFWLHALAVDVCLNLRYPAAGETSGIAVRMMGAGRTVVLTDAPEISRYPIDTCLRVDAGPGEEEMLEGWMEWLSREPARCREIGARAAHWIATHHTTEKVAAAYMDALARAAPAGCGSTR